MKGGIIHKKEAIDNLRRARPHANPYVGRSMRTEGELVHLENAYVKSVNRSNYV